MCLMYDPPQMLTVVFSFYSNSCIQEKGYNGFDVIADYVFKVTHFSVVVAAGSLNSFGGRTLMLDSR